MVPVQSIVTSRVFRLSHSQLLPSPDGTPVEKLMSRSQHQSATNYLTHHLQLVTNTSAGGTTCVKSSMRSDRNGEDLFQLRTYWSTQRPNIRQANLLRVLKVRCSRCYCVQRR